MDDFFNKDKSEPAQSQQPKTVNAKQINVDNYGSMPKGVGMTKIQNTREGVQEFLKRDDKKK